MAEPLRMAMVSSERSLRAWTSAIAAVRGASLAVATHHDDADIDAKVLDDLDVVVVDLRSPEAPFDRFAGATLIGTMHGRGGVGPVTIAVGPPSMSDLVRVRLVEAGADHLVQAGRPEEAMAFVRSIFQDPEPTSSWHPVASLELAEHGLRKDSRLNAGLAYIDAHHLEAAFTTTGSQTEVLSRRRSITVRTALADMIGIDPVDQGSGAVVQRTLPSWRQLRRIMDVARGATQRL